MNTYGYVYQNPLYWTDRLGLASDKNPLQIGDGAFGLGGYGGGRVGPGNKPYLGPNPYHGPKPSYVVNPAHLTAGGGKTLNPNKTPLPKDAGSVFKRCVPDTKNKYNSGPYKDQPRTWWGQSGTGDYYRYSHGNDGTAHFSGSFKQKDPRVPQYIRDRFKIGGGGSGGGKIKQQPLLY